VSQRIVGRRASSGRGRGFAQCLAGYTVVAAGWSLAVEWLAVPAWLNLLAVVVGTAAFAIWRRGRPGDEWGFMWLAPGVLCMRALAPFVDPFVDEWLQVAAAAVVVALIVVWDRSKHRPSAPIETEADNAP